jgi:hypothetical protein
MVSSAYTKGRWRVVEDWKIKIAVLWLIYAAVGLGTGFYMLWEQGVIEQLIAGEIAGTEITPEMMIINAVMLLVPLVMAFLSVTLKDSINRWANIIVGIFSIGLLLVMSIAEAPTRTPAAYAMLLMLSMLATAVLIVWYAWKSKQKA